MPTHSASADPRPSGPHPRPVVRRRGRLQSARRPFNIVNERDRLVGVCGVGAHGSTQVSHRLLRIRTRAHRSGWGCSVLLRTVVFPVTWWVGSASTSAPPGTQRQAVHDQLIGSGHDVDVGVYREHPGAPEPRTAGVGRSAQAQKAQQAPCVSILGACCVSLPRRYLLARVTSVAAMATLGGPMLTCARLMRRSVRGALRL